jgi:hypothetical protein
VGTLAVRPFGAGARDLDVDFAGEDRAAVATEVLAACALDAGGAPLGAEAARALEVGARLGALVEVCRLSGRRSLSWAVACPAAGCDEELEVDLPLVALAEAQAAAPDPAGVRRPTGDDLARWRERPPTDAEIVAALGGPTDAPDDVAAEIGAVLDAADPLVDIVVRTACPACGQAVELPVDLEGELLARARRDQDRILEDVAALAGAFHWSEAEILALPRARRARYLELAGLA